jgi:hypothetical protein
VLQGYRTFRSPLFFYADIVKSVPPFWTPASLQLLRVRKLGLYGYIVVWTLLLFGGVWFALALPFAIAGGWERPSVLVWPSVAAAAMGSIFYLRIWLLPRTEAKHARNVVVMLGWAEDIHGVDHPSNPMLGMQRK